MAKKNKKTEETSHASSSAPRFFSLVPAEPNFNFVGKAKIFFVISGLFILGCMYALTTQGLNYGIDFRGGTEIYLRFNQDTSAQDIRDALEPIGYEGVNVQSYGDADQNEFLIRMQPEDLGLSQYQEQLQTAMNSLSSDEVHIRFSEERMYPSFTTSQDEEVIQAAIESLKLENASVQFVAPFGKSARNEYLVQFAGASARILDVLTETQGADRFEVLQVEEVGQKVGSELRAQALGAVLISIIFILGYVWFRFDFEFSPAAVVALAHDVVAMLGIFAFLHLPFDLSTVAAVLTIVGFSINDTIVIYDRIRENLDKIKGMSFPEIVNLSINQTLSRTVLTSLTLLMTTLMLLLFGGVITQNFAFALTLGVVFGTYSTVFIAAPLTIYTQRYFANKA